LPCHSSPTPGCQGPRYGPKPPPGNPHTLHPCSITHPAIQAAPHWLSALSQTSSVGPDACSTTAALPQVPRSQVVGLPPCPNAPHTLLHCCDQQVLNPAIQTIPTGSQDASRSPYEGLLSAAQQQTSLRPQDTEMWANPPTPLHPPGLALLPRRSNQQNLNPVIQTGHHRLPDALGPSQEGLLSSLCSWAHGMDLSRAVLQVIFAMSISTSHCFIDFPR